MAKKRKRREPKDIRIEVRQEHRIPRSEIAQHFEWEKEDILQQLEHNITDDQFSPKQRADMTEACKLLRSLKFADFLHGWFIPGYAQYVEAQGFDADASEPDVYSEYITEEMDSISRGYLQQARRMRLALQRG